MLKKNFKNKKACPQCLQHRCCRRGYTIIETMISISLFIVVVMAGMDSLLNANLLHQKSQNMRSIMDNLSFVTEDMSRNLRTGTNFHCFLSGDTIPSTTDSSISAGKSCATGWAIAFESAGGDPLNYNDQWVYYISGGKIFKSTQGPYGVSNFIQLTPDEVVIDPVSSFSVSGALPPPGDYQQPLITIHLIGSIILKNTTTPFSLQTSVSGRVIDI
jgi:type II secretory pathway pseudopilin PulG